MNFVKTITIIGLASLLNLSSFGFTKSTLAQTQKNNGQPQGMPSRRVAGGTRGPGGPVEEIEGSRKTQPVIREESCAYHQKPLTAIIPEKLMSITTTGYPSFFFYMPEVEQSQVVEFVLRDEDDNLVYEKTFTTTGNSGIISLSIPQSTSLNPLKVNQNYQWYLSIICDAQNRSKDNVVEGWFKRVAIDEVDPSLTSKLNQVAPIERAKLYLEAGIWHDALTTVAELKRQYPDNANITNKWINLLQSVGLDNMIQEPLIEPSVSVASNNRLL